MVITISFKNVQRKHYWPPLTPCVSVALPPFKPFEPFVTSTDPSGATITLGANTSIVPISIYGRSPSSSCSPLLDLVSGSGKAGFLESAIDDEVVEVEVEDNRDGLEGLAEVVEDEDV